MVSRETLEMELRDRLSLWVDSWGIDVSEPDIMRLVAFARMLAEYEVANIVGTRDPVELLEFHIADSLSCLLHAEIRVARNVVDIGSGAGLPGLVLGVSLPKARVTLIESTGKKAAFMRQAAQLLGICSADVVEDRAEEVGQNPKYRACFDVATARALASLSVLAEYSLPLVKVGGVVLAMKGDPSGEEIGLGSQAMESLGGRLEEVIRVPLLPGAEARSRCLVVIRKERETQKKYPRQVGLPRKQPLGS